MSQRSRGSASQIRLLFGAPSCRGPDDPTGDTTNSVYRRGIRHRVDSGSSAGKAGFSSFDRETWVGPEDRGKACSADAMRNDDRFFDGNPDAKRRKTSSWCGCGRMMTMQGCPSEKDRWILDRLEVGEGSGSQDEASLDQAKLCTHVGTLNCGEVHALAAAVRQARRMAPSLHFSIRDHVVDHNPTMYALDVTHSIEVVMHALRTKEDVREVTISLPYQAFFRMKKLMEVFANSLMHKSSRLQCISLQPVDTFCRHPDFQEMQKFLDQACRLQTFSFLSGTHSRLGRHSPVRKLPPNALESIVSMLVFRLCNG